MTATPGRSSLVSRLSARIGPAGRWVVVELSGEFDVATAPVLIGRTAALVALTRPPRIALEVSQVTFCDSSGDQRAGAVVEAGRCPRR
ncbi:STAS domain-containing protein [Actinomadura nitritigenes]|uniref:STAS domain-containing protein n=1 Tax=Actinomadura nitritigenes TaxID=134602 RepID=UPI003D900BA8